MTAKAIFQHRFDKIEDYLHHRAPYLLVEEIVEIQNSKIHTAIFRVLTLCPER